MEHYPSGVWTYELGGYPVLKKWLGYRHEERLNRTLTPAEARYLRSMVQRVGALLAFQTELNAAYDRATADVLTAEELGIRRVAAALI